MAIWEEIKDLLEPYKKMTWFPKIEERKSDSTSSKFSGIPVLLKEEGWPCCEHCNEPMQLFLQLSSSDLPESVGKPFGNGILQVFYCTNWDKECEVECEAFFPFAKSTLVRVINPEDKSILNIDQVPVKNAFPEKVIVGWEANDDYPNWEELEALGCIITDEQAELMSDLDYPRSKDKLLGWPFWVQGIEYPNCPECGKPMKLIFQIDSEDNLPYMFGDAGCSHITQCEDHRDKMTIAWACY